MSSLAWIDFDEAERQRTQRILAMFQDRESRDELGLGAIRDSLADRLFPGTSTIQTRLRYMLFVPWILQMIEDCNRPSKQIMGEARVREIRLMDALKAGGETTGVIGRDAGAQLRRLPSAVYWAGLGTWGIRLFQGSPESYFTSLGNLRRGRQRLGEDDMASDRPVTHAWHRSLPDMPPDLLKTATFSLTIDEVQFIIDRLVAEQPKALLTMLARNRVDADCRYIWEHPNLADFPVSARRLVKHGEIFSSVMNGAALIYNLQLSELRERDDWIAGYEQRLQQWVADLDLFAIRAWSIDEFWESIEHPAHRIQPNAKRFVTRWVSIVCDGAAGISQSTSARFLIQDRESRLKTSQSRFSNRTVRDRWGGESGAERLSFRWAQAKSHLRDLNNGQ